jgi:NAD-dependent SIR2 family protein deacetylase
MLQTPQSGLDQSHYRLVANEILDGRVIPFLGAGINLADREDPKKWTPPALPSGGELAEYLAERGEYPDGEARDLVRVSQFMGAVLGPLRLYGALHDIFAADYGPNIVHQFLARLPAVLRARGKKQLLVITTNYDDTLERALDVRGEDYDVVYYEAKRGDENWGKLFHRRARSDTCKRIKRPNDYRDLDPETRPVVLKIHGAVNRKEPSADSYVITEDDYIDYLSHNQVSKLALLTARLMNSHCLFLGYSLQDWNLRVILNQIWGERRLPAKSWAVQMPDPRRSQMSIDVERELWDDRGKVALMFEPLSDYIAKLDALIPEPETESAATTDEAA